MASARSKRLFQVASGMYFLMLAAYYFVARFPEGRVWGLNWWAYYPDWVPASLLAVGVLVGVLVIRHSLRGTSAKLTVEGTEDSDLRFIATAVGVSVLSGLLFWLLRGRSHFLGDGYLLLSHLGAGDLMYMQVREIGESLIHVWVKSLLGGNMDDALLGYQVVSIASGFLLLLTLLLSVRTIFRRSNERFLLFLGLATGGYMLLFFGYVENYSVFIVSILVFGVTGILIAKGRLNRWFAVPIVALSVVLHTLGVTLIPSAIYLLVSGTRIEKSIVRWGFVTKGGVVLAAGLMGIALFLYFYAYSYYFRFNIVPLWEDQFVAGGYTLLSYKHLMDFFNLNILLVPSIPLFVVVLTDTPAKVLSRLLEFRFLGILTVSTLGAAFILEPDLGMPRDWDMLSFVSIPLTLLIFYMASRLAGKSGYARGACWLAIMLNLLVLGPRVVSQVFPEISLAHYTNYCRLDKARALNANVAIMNFYRERGDFVAVNEVKQLWRERYPERELLELAARARNRGQLNEALSLARQALRMDPSSHFVYTSLAESFFAARQIDSAKAYLEIANGMWSGNPLVLYSLGHIRYLEGNPEEAEKLWEKSIHLDTTNSEPFLGLATLAKSRGDFEKYEHYLEGATSADDVSGVAIKELADFHYKRGRIERALYYYKMALAKGLPQVTIDQLLKAFPQLAIDSTR